MIKTLSRKLRSSQTLLTAFFRGEPAEIRAAALRGNTNPLAPEPKRALLLHMAKKYGVKTFVETGTFRGDTLAYLLSTMDRLYSIELAPTLFAAAKERFSGVEKIHLLQGDSIDCLPSIVKDLSAPALFWLDAHYSAGDTARGSEDTPIVKELQLIFSLREHPHILLIDDARDFGRDPAYPTLEHIEQIARKNNYRYECRMDIIRLLPK